MDTGSPPFRSPLALLGWIAFLLGALSLVLGLLTLGAGTPPARLFLGLAALLCGLFVLARHGEPHSAE